MTAAKKKLSDRRARFALEYLKDGNATAAAARAGYTQRSAYSTGGRLVKDPDVRAEIDRLKAKVAERAMLDAQYVLDKWRAILESCTQNVVAYSVSGAPLKDRTGAQVYRMLDANVARNVAADLARHLKMFDRVEEKVEDDRGGVLLAQPIPGGDEWTEK